MQETRNDEQKSRSGFFFYPLRTTVRLARFSDAKVIAFTLTRGKYPLTQLQATSVWIQARITESLSKGRGGCKQSGYHKTLSPTIVWHRISRESEI